MRILWICLHVLWLLTHETWPGKSSRFRGVSKTKPVLTRRRRRGRKGFVRFGQTDPAEDSRLLLTAELLRQLCPTAVHSLLCQRGHLSGTSFSFHQVSRLEGSSRGKPDWPGRGGQTCVGCSALQLTPGTACSVTTLTSRFPCQSLIQPASIYNLHVCQSFDNPPKS